MLSVDIEKEIQDKLIYFDSQNIIAKKKQNVKQKYFFLQLQDLMFINGKKVNL